ncbi:AAA family ATPase [Nocardia sp. NBC_01009]|uniref:AAA family ATPase n=1 Tax=Nocardia sp. NBC_01009 TaxID=2975996 RepID=UPI00386C009D
MVNARRHPVIGIVSGPPGSGKSTLAHALATDIGVPAIIRDEIKQGMVAGTAPTSNTGYEDLNIPVLHTFFDVLTLLARSGVSAVAEAAFQDKLWRPNLLELSEFAEIRIIHCIAPQHDRLTLSPYFEDLLRRTGQGGLHRCPRPSNWLRGRNGRRDCLPPDQESQGELARRDSAGDERPADGAVGTSDHLHHQRAESRPQRRP